MSEADTLMLEHSDRMRRLRRLSAINGVEPPEFSEYMIPPSAHHIGDLPTDIPVLRVVFQERVLFDFNKDDLKPEAQAILDLIAQSLSREATDTVVFVAGHTDAIGSEQYNLALGMRRAKAVASALATAGVHSAQLYLVSFGKAVPIADNGTDEGRARNRRVEFLFSARAEAIAAHLIEQHVQSCVSDQAMTRGGCVENLDFPVKSVELSHAASTARPVTLNHSANLRMAGSNVAAPSDVKHVQLKPPEGTVVIGSKIVDIDLRHKIFTMPPPE
jgi:hypothetical protein